MAGRKEWSPDIVGEVEHYKTLQMMQNLLDELDGSDEAGLFTHCNTYHELADYIDDVSGRLREWADWIRDYAKNESFRPRGRMLRESSTAMPVEYVIGRESVDGKWWPIIVYLNESPNRYWYEAICADEGGVYHTELGKGYLSRIRPGTDKCAPEVVDAVEDEFFGQFAVDDIPTHRVDTIKDLEEHAPAGKQLISRD